MLYAFKVGLLAFDATRPCLAGVDFPMDVTLYSRGKLSRLTRNELVLSRRTEILSLANR
jgi:hypothetical protein